MKGEFLGKIDSVRGRAGIPFVVTSGSRCKQHNKDEGGKPGSEHLTGEGADIEADNGFKRWKIVTAAIAVGIRRIGVGDGFVHLGDDLVGHPHPVIWTY
jgi:uncharacterized protein YcbK (DUF882 family)